MTHKQQIIISAYREGKSQRAIARETGVDRKTIRKYLQKYEAKRKSIIKWRKN
ncbi:helix-turn-helix domain-containing protein [Desulfolucanica intricata]|uniref:helix-turn-helix domain-containing protein n=1 Tax=Desulfolucanica intricata TaxID=1285191 RepID=UPI0013520B18|nr:helix-turn-helix domain-containing protein [Desulfolucanica intricata]